MNLGHQIIVTVAWHFLISNETHICTIHLYNYCKYVNSNQKMRPHFDIVHQDLTIFMSALRNYT